MYACCFFELYGDHRDLHVLTHSFPTRRSSDLLPRRARHPHVAVDQQVVLLAFCAGGLDVGAEAQDLGHVRSEEHTSELQSLMRISYAVFCLKKKKTLTRLHKPANFITSATHQHT